MAGRVFILGAGASREDTINADLPMPLANDFFQTNYINKHWHNPDYGYRNFVESNLGSILSHYFGVRLSLDKNGKIISDKSVNIEEVLTFLENFEKVYLTTSYQRDIFIMAKQELLTYIHDVILNTPSHSSPEFLRRLSNSKSDSALKRKQARRAMTAFKNHNRILSKIKREDSIISFNWDLIADSVLLANKKEHYFYSRDKLLNPFVNLAGSSDLGYLPGNDLNQGYFLKLHGSVNMACCTNPDCLRNQFPVVFDEFEADTPILYPCNMCHSPLEILLLPPSINKSYRANRFFKLQAGIAAGKLQVANEIIIIGYSFPLFDFEANSLMRLARLNPREESDDSEDFLEKVIIVNPQVSQRDYVKRISALFGIAQSRRVHGHKVELILFKNISDFIKKYIDKR